jgi:hypothetical protein
MLDSLAQTVKMIVARDYGVVRVHDPNPWTVNLPIGESVRVEQRPVRGALDSVFNAVAVF